MGDPHDDIRIRPASVADALTLARLNRHVHALHVDAAPTLFRDAPDEDIAAALADMLARDGVHARLAERDDGEAIGYMIAVVETGAANAFAHARSRVLVDQIAVAPEARRTGVGHRLVDAAAQIARAHGIAHLDAKVWMFNAPSRDFFQAAGFMPRLQILTRDLAGA